MAKQDSAKRPPKPADQPANPRRRKEGQSKGSAQTVGPIPRLPRHRVTVGVPDAVKIAIADSILAFSDMEATVEIVIWALAGLRPDDGRLFTKLDASEKYEILKSLCTRYKVPIPKPKPQQVGIWTAMNEVAAIRNKIAHGRWAMMDLKTPICFSTRLKADEGMVGIETFPPDRFAALVRQCRRIQMVWEALADQLFKTSAKHLLQPEA